MATSGIKGLHPHGHSRYYFARHFALDRWQIDDPMRAGHPRVPRTNEADGLANRLSRVQYPGG